MKSDITHGPLQDAINLTPMDLLFAGIEITEPTPQYFRFRCVDDGKLGAMHDTPAQAIWSARKCFGVWLEDGTL